MGAVADGEEGRVIHCCLSYSFTSGFHVDTDLFVLFTLQSIIVCAFNLIILFNVIDRLKFVQWAGA